LLLVASECPTPRGFCNAPTTRSRIAAPFDHENLDGYRLAREVALWVHRARFPADTRDLRDQALRPSRSVPLNIAEGSARAGAAGRNHYRIVMGSAAETCAALDLVGIGGAAEQQEKLRRVGAMLRKLAG